MGEGFGPLLTIEETMITAKIIAASTSYGNRPIYTVLATYPRFIHSEVMTHRAFSRNAASSRAIPVEKMIEWVEKNPAMPIHWGVNQPGMQAREELPELAKEEAVEIWQSAAKQAVSHAYLLSLTGLHKQVVNRILEPYQYINTLITATEWDNFFELRAHPDAQPEIQALAVAIRDAINGCSPKVLTMNEWHIPFIEEEEADLPLQDQLKVSVARCARLSYTTFDGKKSTVEKDIALFDKLITARPIHASPAEHQAKAVALHNPGTANFVGWMPYRKYLEN